MKIKMTFLSDVIPGNGESVPGGEDISVLHDRDGFPYYKGGTLKGIFREELVNYLVWTDHNDEQIRDITAKLLGYHGDDDQLNKRKMIFSDFTVSCNVREAILHEVNNPDDILDAFSYFRTFTAIDKSGTVKEGSLRYARCLKKGLILYGSIECGREDEELVKNVLALVKWIGTMRNRGFGQVRMEVCGEERA